MKAKIAILFFITGMACGMFLWGPLSPVKDSRINEEEGNIEILDQQEIQQFHNNDYQNQIIALEIRVKELTEELNIAQGKIPVTDKSIQQKKEGKVKALTQDILIKAGIDEVTAQEIIRRKDEVEYKRLDFRDRAIREGFVGAARFRKELKKLKQTDSIIRDEMGSDVFDRYLYASGKSNRIKVLSIMQGSPAEYSDIVKGDVIISYDEKRVFSWHDLSKSTAEGNRDESVILTVERNGEMFNILVPRGPLGIKLENDRVLP